MCLFIGTSDQLFGFIADSVASVADPSESGKLGFTFSFPMKQERLNHGRLITWTKGTGPSDLMYWSCFMIPLPWLICVLAV